jgi:hypothetical protein
MELRTPALLIALISAAPAFAQTKPMTTAPVGTLGAPMPAPGTSGSASMDLNRGLSAPNLTPSLGGLPSAPPVLGPDGQQLPPPVAVQTETQETPIDVQVVPPSSPEEAKEDDGDDDGRGLSLSWWQAALIALALFAASKIVFGKRKQR